MVCHKKGGRGGIQQTQPVSTRNFKHGGSREGEKKKKNSGGGCGKRKRGKREHQAKRAVDKKKGKKGEGKKGMAVKGGGHHLFFI